MWNYQSGEKKQHISRILPYKQWLTQWLLSHLRTAHQNTAISCKRWYCIVINDIKNDFHQWPKKTKSDFHMTPHNLYNNMCAIKICINIYIYIYMYIHMIIRENHGPFLSTTYRGFQWPCSTSNKFAARRFVKDFNRMCLFLPPVAILGMVYYSV